MKIWMRGAGVFLLLGLALPLRGEEPDSGTVPLDSAAVRTQETPVSARLRDSFLNPEDFLRFIRIIPGEETFRGKGTSVRFPRRAVLAVKDTSYTVTALGSGVRKRYFFKVYECVAYSEAGEGLGPDPYATLIRGDFAKRIHMYFERDMSGEKIRDGFREGLIKVLGGEGWPPVLAQDLEIFLGYFEDSGVRDGQSVDLIWLPGAGLYTVVIDESFPPLNNPLLASALWAVWFGNDPVSKGLKKDMLRFFPGRGKN